RAACPDRYQARRIWTAPPHLDCQRCSTLAASLRASDFRRARVSSAHAYWPRSAHMQPVLCCSARVRSRFLRSETSVGAEPSTAADALQRPLRFQARLTASVDMTSDVKGRERLF